MTRTVALLVQIFIALFIAGYATALDVGSAVITKCEKPGVFGLTFDDGTYLSCLLAILREKDVKATFFVLGIQASNVSLGKFLKQAYEEGHQIASHTNTHRSLNTLTPEQIKEEMIATETSVKRIIGAAPAYMRPPYGDCNPACQAVMNEMNMRIITWNVDSNDWQYVTGNQEKLVLNVKSQLKTGNPQSDSWISLQHDIHRFSIEKTSTIIDFIRSSGYRFETIADCLNNKWPMYKDGVPNNVASHPSANEPNSTVTVAANIGSVKIPSISLAALGIIWSLVTVV
ncbi:glycoside hydrolase/deacetylase [Basidiobolus meristosporus CBS 931.73]|uniref:Glycoside hydrolase/deacetylase n=1 Tax=Basidiobolus meristosporus CBS 931.73 TaxID=1314790 RepID=A0A1Y1XYK0_9FUNG|nr:glycoside hydrolase/deacetylase [Basidiobolus meristosporus CBS 931.73]|eukprot:ORX90735.1 glycoside hydrolase/deacetylase [Basidiobolus meristosporus CBS 931.73]